MGFKGSGTMLKKLSAISIALLITTASSMSVFAGNTEGFYTPSHSITGSAVTSPSALERYNNTTGSAVSRIDSKADETRSKAAFEKAFDELLRDGKAMDNGQFIMLVTKPDKDKEEDFLRYGEEGKADYLLTGKSNYNDVIITIAKYDEASCEYKRYNTTMGESSWKSSELSDEIPLTKGANKIKILVYRESQINGANLDNVQVNSFTISLFSEAAEKSAVKKNPIAPAGIGKEIENGLTKLVDLLRGK